MEENLEGECLKDPNAFRIYEEIIKSLGAYPNDSNQASFFLPETIIINCRSVAAAFTMSLYGPPIGTSRVYNTKLYSYFLLASVCGVQTFLKERSIIKNHAPFTIQANIRKIKKAQQVALEKLTLKPPITQSTEQVIIKFLLQLSTAKEKANFEIKGKKLSKDKIDTNLSSAILWGYYFAKEMVLEK